MTRPCTIANSRERHCVLIARLSIASSYPVNSPTPCDAAFDTESTQIPALLVSHVPHVSQSLLSQSCDYSTLMTHVLKRDLLVRAERVGLPEATLQPNCVQHANRVRCLPKARTHSGQPVVVLSSESVRMRVEQNGAWPTYRARECAA